MKQAFTTLFIAAAILTALTACVTTKGGNAPTSSESPAAAPAPAVEPPAADRNLIGFPLGYRQGYHDGCQTARGFFERRDEERFKKDGEYRLGWQDGYSICAKQFKKK